MKRCKFCDREYSDLDEDFLVKSFMSYVNNSTQENLYKVATDSIGGTFREIIRYNYFLNLL